MLFFFYHLSEKSKLIGKEKEMEKISLISLLDQNNSLELWKPLYFFQAFLETVSKEKNSSRNKKAF